MNARLIQRYNNRGGIALIDNHEVTNTPSSESRIIFIYNKTIFKFDAFTDEDPDDSQCGREVDFWFNKIEDKDKRYFAPIVAHGDNWIAQELIEFDNDLDRENYYFVIRSIARKYGLCDIEKYKNWGIRKSDYQPIIYDYGV